jgi:Spy/CpxP family protein refolding chaperone
MVLDRLVNNPHVVEKIGLSEAQVQTLRQAGEQIRKELQRIKAEREVASLDQARRMLDDSIDEAAVMANVEKIGKLNTDIAKLKMKQLIVLRQTLTPEQLGRMKENRKRTDEKRTNSGAAEGEHRNKRLERGEQPAAAEPASNSTNAPNE